MITCGRFRIHLDTASDGVVASIYDEHGLICAVCEPDAKTAIVTALGVAKTGFELEANSNEGASRAGLEPRST
jgi:hypothetical protein